MRFISTITTLLLCGCSGSALHDLPTPDNIEISAQIERLNSTCQHEQNRYILKQLHKLQTTQKPEEYLLLSALQQDKWIEYQDNERCKAALAINTLEGMTYLLKQKKLSSQNTNKAKLSVANALMWREYLKPTPENDNLKTASQLINEYIADEAKGKPADRAYYMHASYTYMKIADNLRDKATARTLTLKSLELARKGFYSAEDKFHTTITYYDALYRLIDLTPKDSNEFHTLINEMIQLLTQENHIHISFAPVSIGFYQALAGNHDEAINTFMSLDDEDMKLRSCSVVLDDRLEDFRNKNWISITHLIRKSCPNWLPKNSSAN